MSVETRVELVVDDTEQQLLTPVLRHFLANGYNPRAATVRGNGIAQPLTGLEANEPVLHDPEQGDQIRLESPDGYVVVRSEFLDPEVLLQIDLTGDEPVFTGSGVLLSITSSNHDRDDLRHAVGMAITTFGGLAASGDDPLDADHVFTDGRGIRRAVLRRPSG